MGRNNTLIAAAPEDPSYGTLAPRGAALAVLRTAQRLAPRGWVRSTAGALLRRTHGTLVDDTLFGLRFRFDLANAGDRKALFAIDRCDPEERQLIIESLPPGGVFADVGASHGLYSLHVAATRPDVTVLAFEPFASAYRRLAYNIAINQLDGRIHALSTALGDRKGMVAFESRTESAASGSGDSMVPVETLAGVLAARQIDRLDAIKLDVEGYEDRILAPYLASTMAESLPRLVIIEHALRTDWQIDCLDLLSQGGFREIWRGTLNAAFLRSDNAGTS